MLKPVVLAAFVLAVAPASAQALRHGHVRLTAMSPAVVHGSGFYAGERVTVTVRGSAAVMRKSVMSTASGAFTVRFGREATTAGCHGIAVSAVGARGDRADWKTAPAVCGTSLAP